MQIKKDKIKVIFYTLLKILSTYLFKLFNGDYLLPLPFAKSKSRFYLFKKLISFKKNPTAFLGYVLPYGQMSLQHDPTP